MGVALGCCSLLGPEVCGKTEAAGLGLPATSHGRGNSYHSPCAAAQGPTPMSIAVSLMCLDICLATAGAPCLVLLLVRLAVRQYGYGLRVVLCSVPLGRAAANCV